VAAPSAATFTKDTAAKTGLSERTVRKDIQIAEGLTDAAKEALRSTKVADSPTQLLTLSKQDERTQERAAKLISEGKAKNVAEAIEKAKPKPPPDEPEIDLLHAATCEPDVSEDPSQPWADYNAELDQIVADLRGLRDRAVALAKRSGTEAAFVAWMDPKQQRTFFENAAVTYEKYKITGWATEAQAARLPAGRNFFYAFESSGKGKKGDAVSSADEPQGASAPWAGFNSDIEALRQGLRALKRQLAAVTEYDGSTRQMRCRWAQGYSPAGTLGTIDSLIMALKEGMPVEASNEYPGYLTAYRAELKRSVEGVRHRETQVEFDEAEERAAIQKAGM
jgi:hypothetical protein